MLVKLGTLWVDPTRVAAIYDLAENSIHDVSGCILPNGDHIIEIFFKDVSTNVGNRISTAGKSANEFASIINNYYQPGYPDADPANT